MASAALAHALALNNPILSTTPTWPCMGWNAHSVAWPHGDIASLVRLSLTSCWAGEMRQAYGTCQECGTLGCGERTHYVAEVRACMPDFCWTCAPYQTQPNGFLAARFLAAANSRGLPTTGFLRFAQLSSLATFKPLLGLGPAPGNASGSCSCIQIKTTP